MTRKEQIIDALYWIAYRLFQFRVWMTLLCGIILAYALLVGSSGGVFLSLINLFFMGIYMSDDGYSWTAYRHANKLAMLTSVLRWA